eukprot:363132-Chlamydomonas_euryale.AAC.27
MCGRQGAAVASNRQAAPVRESCLQDGNSGWLQAQKITPPVVTTQVHGDRKTRISPNQYVCAFCKYAGEGLNQLRLAAGV